ncbi:AsmA family protein [Congregibacter brevis]|uniref:AsmA family protein n=1 Tax=Congregibacter brevis TaxID=3081201 RepID=A0ABZ0I8W4_9GAMM|nr:AsmA family protein [Congregibacter sp. IMCC45268]
MRLKPTLLLLIVALGVGASSLALSLRHGLSLGFAGSFLEARISEALSRQITFYDPPYIQINSGLRLSLSNVTLANAEWAESAEMLELQFLEAVIDPWTLFDDQIIVDHFSIQGLKLRLHKDSNGASNLPELSLGANDGEEASSPGPPPVAVKHLEVRDVHIQRRNDKTGNIVDLLVDSLTQDALNQNTLSVAGNGKLQDRPWRLEIDSSGFNTVQTGRNMSATFTGGIGELKLEGSYQIPDIAELRNLTLDAQLSGPMPDRLAELSPMLEADDPANIVLQIKDVEPGLDLKLQADLPHLTASLHGSIDSPGSGDGMDLDMQLDADSLPRLAQALGLGPGADVPLSIKGRLLRNGKRIEFRDSTLTAGSNHLEADVVLPAFPGTNGGTVHLRASGPDFSFYQKLLELTPNLEKPYSFDIDIQNNVDRGEYVEGKLSIGAHELQLSGTLDNFPNYAGSDLKVDVSSPSLRTIAANFGVDIPDTPLSVNGNLSISDDAVISIHSADVFAYDIHGQLEGRLNSYPKFDNADIHLTADAQSLNQLGQRLGLATLGEAPVSLAVDVKGKPESVVISNPRIRVGGLSLEGRQGGLRYADNALSSDLQLVGQISNVNALLGDYASDYLPSGSYSFELAPKLTPDLFSVDLQKLSGPEVSGDARLELSRDFSINERTVLESNLRFDDISQLIPDFEGYSTPQNPLTLRSVTRQAADSTKINAEIFDDESALLSVDITVPSNIEEGISLSVRGSGNDLRSFGSVSFLPQQLLSYNIEVNAEIKDQITSLDAQSITLGESVIRGDVRWDNAEKSLLAAIEVPEADLQTWIVKRKQKDTAENASEGNKDRLIPDIPLRLQWLRDYRIDLSVTTGPLGLEDPQFVEQSLVEKATLRLKSGDGQGLLTIENLEGSRGKYEGNLSISDTDDLAELKSELTVASMPLGVVAAGAQYEALPRYDLRSALTASGNSLRAVTASLDGEFLMTGGSGTLRKMKLSAATESFVAQVFQTLLPMLTKGQTNMEVECTVLAARAEQGVLSLDPGFVFRSAQIDLSAQGQIDLRSEKLNISFNNRARKGLGISAASVINPFVAVTGTLAKPSLGLDIASSAISGGAAVASAGVTIIAKPLLERIFARGNPCEAAMEAWNEPTK